MVVRVEERGLTASGNEGTFGVTDMSDVTTVVLATLL